MFFPSRSLRFHSIPSPAVVHLVFSYSPLPPSLLASFVRYVQSGIWLSVVKRVYSCLKVLNLKLYLFVTVGRKFAALVCLRLHSPSYHYTRNLIKALFAPRVLISAARYGIAFPITIKRSSWKHGPLLYSIMATTETW